MRRYGMLAATAVGALLTSAAVGDAAPTARARADATVTAVSVVPGAGRADVVLTFEGTIDVSTFTLEAPHRIVVDLQGATMRLREPRYDRVARAGIRNVRLGQFAPDVVRLVLDVDTPREYEVTRGEGEIRVSVRGSDDFAPWSTGAAAVRATPVAAAPSEPTFEPIRVVRQQVPTQPRISVSFPGRNIHEVIATFADFSGRTFVTGSSVTGTVHADIVNQPWDVALSKILQQSGLQATEDSTGIITIDSYANLSRRVAAEPLVTQLVVINYAKASALAGTIRQLIAACSSGSAGAEAVVVDAAAAPVEGGAPAAGAGPAPTTTTCGRGVVTFEEKTNTLLITETVSRLPEIVSYVRDLDVRTPQVAIKAKIIAVDRTATEELGLSYEIGSPTNYSNTLIPRGTPGEFQIDLGGDAFIGVANANRTFGSTGALSLIYNTVIGGNNLAAFLDALSSEQLSDVQAEPSTTTIDNRKASLFAGTEIAFLLTPPAVPGQIQAIAPVIQRQKIGITLEVTPHVTANRQVSMEISASQQSLLGITVAGPEISERTARNEVLVGDGETAVIAGLTQTQVTRVKRGVPILMRLPIIGRLFSETSVIERKQDLLILVTPHIVDEGEVVRSTPPTP
ncbi:MAG: AMIN domain-containing protein [Gemmatimonadaceae bacterium]